MPCLSFLKHLFLGFFDFLDILGPPDRFQPALQPYDVNSKAAAGR